MRLEESAQRLRIERDLPLQRDESHHLRLGALGCSTRYFAIGPAFSARSLGCRCRPSSSQIASSSCRADNPCTVRIARSVRPTAAPTCADVSPMPACSRKNAAARNRIACASMAATNHTAASSSARCGSVARCNSSACVRSHSTYACATPPPWIAAFLLAIARPRTQHPTAAAVGYFVHADEAQRADDSRERHPRGTCPPRRHDHLHATTDSA
jgi:hypothetical protein